VHNEAIGCLELSYVGLCCELVWDCEHLEKMAALLGREAERVELEERRMALSARINTVLWDEDAGFYKNKHWNGEFDPCVSLFGFYPLTAGIVPEERLERVMARLLNPEEFWGDCVIPTVSRCDPAFESQQYWRGRIWAPTNFLVGEGLLRIGRKDIYDELTRKGLSLFLDCWRKLGAVGENYNAITGETAEPEKWSDRFYHWGSLLVYMAVEHADRK
jgi:neutral trehalase